MRQFRLISWLRERKASVLAHYGYHKIDAEEMAVVEQYRVWRSHQQMLAGGGCGGCPSQGECSDAE